VPLVRITCNGKPGGTEITLDDEEVTTVMNATIDIHRSGAFVRLDVGEGDRARIVKMRLPALNLAGDVHEIDAAVLRLPLSEVAVYER
jgi:hypothetical protein